MTMSKNEFGNLLNLKLKAGSDITELSRWAFQIFNENSHGLAPDLKTILLDLARMEDAPEFEYTHEELVSLARTLSEGTG